MPCDQVRTTTTQWTEATDLKLVKLAMEALGYEQVRFVGSGIRAYHEGHDITVSSGKLTTRSPYGESFDDAPLRQRYAAEVVKDRFTALGWNVEEQGKAKAVAGFTREW